MQGSIGDTGVRKTCPQNWRAYNAAQTHEKELFLGLLRDLCAGVELSERQTNGRPRLPLNDALFAICYKIFSTVSGRRFMSDLRDAKAKGYIDKALHYNSIFSYLDKPELTPILHALIVRTSLPLASIENDFAADSSGFTASSYCRWQDHKYGKKQQRDWVKTHIMCGVKTNIITAVEIRDRYAHDVKLLPLLLKTTSEHFKIREVSADKAYGSFKNYDAIEQVGATPYILFKEPQRTQDNRHLWVQNNLARRPSGHVLWDKMYHYFQFYKDDYLAHYHKRSNVETTFSMIKAKFGGYVRSKTDVAMVNEVLCKIICHNTCVLIQEMHELGIDVNFNGLLSNKTN